MLSDSKKVSIRQAIFLVMTVTFSPAIRLIPSIAAKEAKQAALLSTIIPAVMLALLSMVWDRLYRKYKDASLMDIYSDITGKFAGKILIIIHLIWMTLLTALYARYFAIKIVGTIFTNVNVSVFIISMFILVIYILRSGLITLARFNEFIHPVLVVIFVILIIMLIPYIKLDFLSPVSYRSIVPVISAGTKMSGIIVYFTFVFIIGDKINNKECIKKVGLQASVFYLVLWTLLLISTIGTLTHFIVARAHLPFMVAVKQISLFDTLEKMESVVVALWTISDFVLISFFVLLDLNLIKSLFKFSDEKPILNIFIVFMYFLSLYITNSVFELEKLSMNVIIPGNIILGFILPVVMLFIGKLRKKI